MDRIKLYQVLVHFLLGIDTTNENAVLDILNWKGTVVGKTAYISTRDNLLG